jgi:RHS repeat-associated protein
MKRNIKSFLPAALLLLLTQYSLAQQVTNPATNLPQDVQNTTPTPLVYPDLTTISGTLPVNYVRTQVPDKPFQNITGYDGYIRQTTQYIDGLGRPLQEVAKNAHSARYDLVQHHVYDAAGNEKYHYLPFVLPSILSSGNLVRPADTRIHQFYDQLGPDEQPYSQTETDNSPLNRVTKQMSPGRSWVGSNRGVEIKYKTNPSTVLSTNGVVAHDYRVVADFPIFTIGPNSTDVPQYAGGYEPNSLLITETKDEDGNITQEVKDKSGRLVMQRKLYQKVGTLIFPAAIPAESLPVNFATTLYVYDDLGRLRVVMPPEVCKPLMTIANVTTPYQITTYTFNWQVSAQQLTGLCFQYFYDERGRLVEKRIPGKDVEYYVYDKRDRQVLSQDGNLRTQQKWAFTIYDALDRPLNTGLFNSADSRSTLQSQLNNATTYAAPHLNSVLKNYTHFNTDPGSLTGCTFWSYTYYDNYNELASFNYDASQFNGITLPSNGTVVPSSISYQTKGKVTGNIVRVMDPDNASVDNWLTAVNYYDANGRLIQTQSENFKYGLDISSNIYYFQGMIWKNILLHQNPAALAIPGTNDGVMHELAVVKTFELNLTAEGGNDQVYRVTQKIGNGAIYDLAYYKYDHLGRVTVKQFPAADVLQEYNIRGFLNHIKVANFNNNTATNQLDPHIFEENLYYDKGFTSKLYNGNIAGITWKKAGTQAPVEAYGYSYDQLSRLGHAEYVQKPVGAAAWSKTAYDYTASNIKYDLNGNIKSMDQRGNSPNPIPMDQLVYTYAPGSNKLVKVYDNVAASATALLPDFKDKADLQEEYLYDANGNMTADQNKGIGSITYSILNKPEKINVSNQGSITYVYDAAGNRLQKKVLNYSTGNTEVYDYIGNFVYKDNVLQYILNEEGRTRPLAIANTTNAGEVNTKFVYDYFVKDHLGNVRSTVTAKPIDNIYLAKHEIASANVEQLLFDNIPNVRDAKPGATTVTDGMAARLNGGDASRRIGTAIMLRTMPGDRFNISADVYYDGSTGAQRNATPEEVISSLMGALTGGSTYAGVPLSELPENIRTIKGALGNPQLATQLNQLLNTNDNPDAPKAHLNYLFFNDKLELVPGSSGSVQVPVNANGWVQVNPGLVNNGGLTGGGVVVSPGPGYVIIYIDNQTIGKDVWFDNVMVGHYKGEVIEESHYYPFGLTLQTSQAAGAADQPHKYQGIELEKHFGLETYETFYRGLDPQLGKFNQVDPKAELDFHLSPYVSMGDNPVANMDPLGDNPILFGLLEAAVEAIEVEEVIGATEVLSAANSANSMVDKGSGLAHQRRVIAESRKVQEAVNSSISTVIEGTPAMGRFLARTAAVAKQLAKNYEGANKASAKPTSRAARREAMRKQGIPTSQQPKKQRNNKSGREYDYDVPEDGGGTKTKSVQERTMDRGHENDPHWEAGDVKVRDGEVQQNQHGSPKLESSKSKVEYEN